MLEEIHEIFNTLNLCQTNLFPTYLVGLVVECFANYLKVSISTPPQISMVYKHYSKYNVNLLE